MSQRDVVVLVHHGCHGVASSRRAIAGETKSGTATHEESSEHRGHEGLVGQECDVSARLALYEPRHYGEHAYGIHRLDAEAPPQGTVGQSQQQYIQPEIGH